MRQLFTILLLGAFCWLTSGPAAHAGEMDILLQKLVTKGVLTAGEAQEIKTETKEQVRKELAEGKSPSVPSWAQNMRIKGDMRLRYQTQKKKQANAISQQRGRVRLRVGVETLFKDNFKGAFGLASGNNSDARSTNQTFTGTFDKKSLWIDYAYVDYSPYTWMTLTGGRMKNPIWEPGDLLWDTDINPEGGAAKFAYKLTPEFGMFFNASALALQESSSDNSDPYLLAFQPGINWNLTENIKLNTAVALYSFQGLEKNVLDQRPSSTSNTMATVGANQRYRYKFTNLVNPAVQIGFTDPLEKLSGFLPSFISVPYAAIFGEYIDNPDPDKGGRGYLYGITVGNEKVAGKNQWQAKYIYRHLGKDAFPDSFPDSDSYGGQTNVKGHEAILTLGLSKNVQLGFDYYNSKTMSGAERPEVIYQVDLSMKF